MLEIGSVIKAKYKILSKIGQGGMSVVYLALDELANKTWAIKEVKKDGMQDFASVRQRLACEADILMNLSHRCLPEIIDVVDEDDVFLIVMDYIQGKTLKRILEEKLENGGMPVPLEDVISWGYQLCDVLAYLHMQPNPIIYRDLKPSNVMLRPDGSISLIDFGTARIFKQGGTSDTVCLGTPGYAAPEQYGSDQTEPQTDIYCLGAMMHHLLTGRSPADTPFNFPPITDCDPALVKNLSSDMRNQLLGMEIIISRCTQYDKSNRYQSCLEVQYDLQHPEKLALPYRKQMIKKLRLFVACVVLTLIFGTASLAGIFMTRLTSTRGYDYYIESALIARLSDRAELYEKAIALNPRREEAYLLMLEMMLEDNVFSGDEDAYLISILNARSGGRDKDNRAYLQTNASGYMTFAYQIGLAYYYLTENDDKASASGWFKIVANADMVDIDLGANNSYKDSWQARAKILGRISDYYKSSKIGRVNEMGDAEVSYKDYWDDLMSLLDIQIAGSDNMVTELRLYSEIVYQIYTRTIEFKNQAGLDMTVLSDALTTIERRMEGMYAEENSLVNRLKNSLSENIKRAEKNIQAVYAS